MGDREREEKWVERREAGRLERREEGREEGVAGTALEADDSEKVKDEDEKGRDEDDVVVGAVVVGADLSAGACSPEERWESGDAKIGGQDALGLVG